MYHEQPQTNYYDPVNDDVCANVRVYHVFYSLEKKKKKKRNYLGLGTEVGSANYEQRGLSVYLDFQVTKIREMKDYNFLLGENFTLLFTLKIYSFNPVYIHVE